MIVELKRDEDLEQLLERSKTDPVLIFKHSTQCSISGEVHQEFVRFAETAVGLACGLVLVIENRDVSNAVEAQLGVRHESPQAIVVRDGRSTWNASHWSVTTDSLAEALRDHAQSPH